LPQRSPLLAHSERKPLLGIEGRAKQGKRTNNMFGCSIKKNKSKIIQPLAKNVSGFFRPSLFAAPIFAAACVFNQRRTTDNIIKIYNQPFPLPLMLERSDA
jgi:hypothetical protein